jgi:hypothetical protein
LVDAGLDRGDGEVAVPVAACGVEVDDPVERARQVRRAGTPRPVGLLLGRVPVGFVGVLCGGEPVLRRRCEVGDG